MSKGLRILGHPVHPALTDFPLVLLVAAPIADIGGPMLGDAIPPTVGFWLLAAGLVAAAPTALAGLIDLLTIPTGTPAMRTALWHMSVMLTAVSLSGLALLLRATDHAGGTALALEVAGAVLLFAGGWLGGHLVFHHGVGVDRHD